MQANNQGLATNEETIIRLTRIDSTVLLTKVTVKYTCHNMRLFVLLAFSTALVTSTQVNDESDVMRLIKLWGIDEHQDFHDNGPFKECVKEFKECVSSGRGGVADEQACRKGFCSCRENMCQAYFKSCGSNPWCSLGEICPKSSVACRSRPKKESKCRRSLMKCLKKSLDELRTNECMKTYNDCLS